MITFVFACVTLYVRRCFTDCSELLKVLKSWEDRYTGQLTEVCYLMFSHMQPQISVESNSVGQWPFTKHKWAEGDPTQK